MYKKFKRFLSHHSRPVQIVALALVLTLVVFAGWMLLSTGSGSDKTRMSIAVYKPTITHFTDDISAVFLSADNTPDINDNRNLSAITPLEISYTWNSGDYSEPFRANLTDDDLNSLVKITPFIRGKFHFVGPYMITFTPEVDWPANQKFSVKLDKGIFNSNVSPNTRRASFQTPKLNATLDSFNIYPDVVTPRKMVGVAIVSFNYPVDTANFSDKVVMKLDGEHIDFSVRFDRFHRTAFIISTPIAVTNKAQVLRLKINQIPIARGDAVTNKLTAHTTVESADNFFKISGITTAVADDNNTGNAQQLILIDTTTAPSTKTNWDEFITAYLLPQNIISEEEESHKWAIDEITPDVLAASEQLKLAPVDFATPHGVYQHAFSYDVSDKVDRYIYVAVKPGIESVGGFRLKNETTKVLTVPYPDTTVEIAGRGAILSLAGDKKLGIVAHGGVDTAYINLYKIKSTEINHLISQTYDVFAKDIVFKSWSFDAYDLATVFQKTIPFADTSRKNTQYASFDLGEYLDRTGADKTGIFMIQTAPTAETASASDKRLILLTNLGLIRKVNLDGTSVVFVSELSSGTPASEVDISVLGRNGNPIWAGQTDENGRADIPHFAQSEYKNAREPIAVVARRADDVSFIPYGGADTRVEYSKFDIDGTYYTTGTPMNAYVFSDRGIYRPGENAIIAGIIKNKSFKATDGIPVKLEIRNSRDRIVLERMFTLSPDGVFDIKYTIPTSAVIGEYTTNVFSLNTKNKPQDILGTTTFRVEEFTPDTMKISANLVDTPDTGWIVSNDIATNVSLQNLFGTPATDCKVTVHATLRPTDFVFKEYRDFTFTPNYISDGMSDNATTRAQTFSADIESKTDDKGTAIINIDFNRKIPAGTYTLNLNIRGFENDNGNGVQTAISARTSDAKYLIGYRATSDLQYINKNASQSVELIALDNTANQIAVNDMTLRLVRRENLTSLIKDANDYYKYQTVTRDNVISQNKLNISADGTTVKLDTSAGGHYYLQVLDDTGRTFANIEYYVVSNENDTLQTDTNAEMQIKLNKETVIPGDTIDVNIVAPYTGAGLITIERDKVYAAKWFSTTGTSSVQTITVPKTFEGTGYINVSFVRNINSRDIFTTPYAYAVAPFATDTSEHKIDIKLTAPQKTDNNKLNIEYETNADAKLMIFAVNTGILQVAKYALPNPLAYFFKKSALQVDTFQTLALLLPEYKILREFAKTGGSDYGEIESAINQVLTNPFARQTEKSVAFYSEIIDAKKNAIGNITFDIPESFNGNIKIYAVAANASAVGSANTETLIQSPIIISATTPVAVAPNDEFYVNTVITNMLQTADVNVVAKTDGSLTIKGTSSATLNIAENTDKTMSLTLHAGNTPGNAELTVDANILSEDNTPLAKRTAVSTTSIRPITPFTTNINTGILSAKTTSVRNIKSNMYKENGGAKIYISHNADSAIRPLFEYLSHYEYDCSEQLVSRALPYALLKQNKFLGLDSDTATRTIANTINILKNRQNDDGSFDLWSGDARGPNGTTNTETAYLTAYVAEFLTIAKSKNFNVPRDMLSHALDYLRTYAGGTISSASDAVAVAYAIYVITQNGYVPTSYIDIFTEYANANIKNWQTSIMGAYIAASYKMLKKNDIANTIIAKYIPSENGKFIYNSMFDNNVANDSHYTYIMTHYFDMTLGDMPESVRAYINSGNYSAYTSAIAIMALADKNTNSISDGDIVIMSGKENIRGKIESGTFVATVPNNADKLTINCKTCTTDTPLIFTLAVHGFPRTTRPETNGIEIVREYYNAKGKRITSAQIGDTITVKIFLQTNGSSEYISNAVILDLFPGGFMPDFESLTGDVEFSELREDRAIIYTDVSRTTREISYTARATSAGTFAIPPIHIESMYNPGVNATGTGGIFTVSNNVADK